MSAKPGKKSARPLPPGPGAPQSDRTAAPPAMGSEATAGAPVAWIDSPDPRRRQLGRVLLGAIWVYVAALWLLALDQTFDWGVF